MICRKCNVEKPLSEFEFRPDAQRHRRTCNECRRDGKNAINRKWYKNHKEREQAKQRQRRKDNLDEYRLRDAKYNLTHQEQRRRGNQDYYHRNRERLITEAIERRRRYRSLDYGWTIDLPNDRMQMAIWSDMASVADMRSQVEDLLSQLTDYERQMCERYMSDGLSLPEHVLVSIREKVSQRN